MSNPVQVMASVATSNIVAIVDELFAIAHTDAGITWHNATEWDLPEAAQVDGAPWLAVTWPQFVSSSADLDHEQSYVVRHEGEVWFTWDIDVYCLAPYVGGDANTYRIPTEALTQLVQTFTKYENLNGTCDVATVSAPRLLKIGKAAANGPASVPEAIYWFAAMVTVRVTENIQNTY